MTITRARPRPVRGAPRDVAPAAPRLVEVLAGVFRMGADDGRDDERPAHAVRLRRFQIGRTPVTRAEYAEFLAAAGAPAPPWWDAPGFAEPDQPVVGVTWTEAAAYGAWLSARHGSAWRLPTEAEWERAARGGLEGAPTAWGAELPAGEVPWGPLRGPWPVGRGTANGFGLYDVTTVVHEWCLDWYAAGYGVTRDPASPLDDPRGPAEGTRRSSRGGSWRHHVRWSPPSARSSLPPGFRYADYGFRVVREAE